MKKIGLFLFFVTFFYVATFGSISVAQKAAQSPDLFSFAGNKSRPDGPYNNAANCNTLGKTLVSSVINTSVKNLVWIIDGQSNATSVVPSTYTPTNASSIVNVNPCDGATYESVDPVLGSSNSTLGAGSVAPRVADTLITNGKFSKVWLVPIAIGGTAIGDHDVGGVLWDRPCVAMRRLQNAGITVGLTNTTFIYTWNQGESDVGQPQAYYQAAFLRIVAGLKSCLNVASQFNGKVFIATETMLNNATDANIQAAQAAVRDGVNIFAFDNMDSLTEANRQADGTHLSTAGAIANATQKVNALAATGAPF